jgi:hypothetical protein
VFKLKQGDSRPISAAVVLEFASIVIGVLLALGLSEWAEDRENRRLAETALFNIHSEIGANQQMLQLIHENNVTTVEMILNGDLETEGRNIIPGMQLQETAWEAFLATGLSAYVDYDELLTLSELYGMQRIYKQTGQQLSQSVMNATAYSVALGAEIDDTRFRNQFVVYFELLTTIEAQLLDAYASASRET